MNLIGDPWIPVVFQEGQNRTVGLNDLYEQAGEIRDLALAPPQRIAVMRLLICITQAALNGPEDKDEWLSCKSRIAPESLKYLAERKEKFDLFGETPFMQIRDLQTSRYALLDKLDLGLAAGNNKTLFDQSSTPEGRIHPTGWASLHLLTFLNFSTGGTSSQAIWHNQSFGRNANHAPALNAAHAFVRGNNFCETIWLNLLTKENVNKMSNPVWGKPIWDAFPQFPDDKACVENANRTYLGRLVPLSRLIKTYPLEKGNDQVSYQCIIGPPPKSLVFEGPPAYREPSASIVENKQKNTKKKYIYLTMSVDKHIWRDLGSVLVLNNMDSDTGGAMTLENLRYIDNETDLDIWVGGLKTGLKGGDIADAVEWNLSIPSSILGDIDLTSYQANVALADKSADYLRIAVEKYLKVFLKEKKTKKNLRPSLNKQAQTIYWQGLDQNYGVLLKDTHSGIDAEWRRIIQDALLKAYGQSCIHETPRQIQAFVAGQTLLHKLIQKGNKYG